MNKKAFAILILFATISISLLAVQPVEYYYKATGDHLLSLDLYVSESAKGSFPVIAYVHGGSWIHGDKRSDFKRLPQGSLEKILDKGFALVSIDYRLATETIKYPIPVTDCKDALRWLRKNARQLKLDPNRIALWGVSAGGHLTLLAGLTPEHMFIDDNDLVDYSSEVNVLGRSNRFFV